MKEVLGTHEGRDCLDWCRSNGRELATCCILKSRLLVKIEKEN